MGEQRCLERFTIRYRVKLETSPKFLSLSEPQPRLALTHWEGSGRGRAEEAGTPPRLRLPPPRPPPRPRYREGGPLGISGGVVPALGRLLSAGRGQSAAPSGSRRAASHAASARRQSVRVVAGTTTTLVAVSATAGAAASAPGGLGGCLASFCSRPALSFLNSRQAATLSRPPEQQAMAASTASHRPIKGSWEQELYDFLWWCPRPNSPARVSTGIFAWAERQPLVHRVSLGSPTFPGAAADPSRTNPRARARARRRAGRLRSCGPCAAQISSAGQA